MNEVEILTGGQPPLTTPTAINVLFPDPLLAQEIATELGRTVTSTVMQSDLDTITIVDIDDIGVADIEGMQYLVNLTHLTITNGKVLSSINQISGLINLTELILFDNNISDISPVAGLVNLTYLHITSNNISDINPISGLVNLTYLDVGNNNINDISPISGLVNLIHLGVGLLNVSDISPVSELVNLDELYINGNNISDISPVSGLVNLILLYADQCNISDASPASDALPSSEIKNQIIDLPDVVVDEATNIAILDIFGNTPIITFVSGDGTYENNQLTWHTTGNNQITWSVLGGNHKFSGQINQRSILEPITDVVINGANQIYKNQSSNYTATVNGNNVIDNSVTWELLNNQSSGTTLQVVSSTEVIVNVAQDEMSSSIILRARSVQEPNVISDKTINIRSIAVESVVITGSQLVTVGNTSQYTAEVLPPEAPQEVTWSILNNTLVETSINQTGLLVVALEEMATTIQVRATSQDGLVVGALDVAIKPIVTGLEVTGSNQIGLGTNEQYIATLTGHGNVGNAVSWSISENTSSTTEISETGLLYADIDELAPNLIVRATAVLNNAIYDELVVQVVPSVTLITIHGATEIDAGNQETYTVTVEGYGNYDDSVTWDLSGESDAETNFDPATGILTAGVDEISPSVMLTATSVYDSDVFDTHVVYVNSTIIDVTIDGKTSLQMGEGSQYVAYVTGTGNYSQAVSWSLTGNMSPLTTINSSGFVRIGADEQADTVVIRAISIQDGTKYDDFEIEITIKIPEVEKELILYTWNRSKMPNPRDPRLKGGMLPAQHEALTRLYMLQQEGVYPDFLNEFKVSYAGITATIETGTMSAYGYLVENNDYIQENMKLSESGVSDGSIGIRIDLFNNKATLYNYLGDFTLRQENLNTRYLDGIYEYELFRYQTDTIQVVDFEITGALNFMGMGKVIDLIYPIGSIYMTTSSTSPSSSLGGKWERYAKGRTLVALDTAQTEFNSIGKTGGHKSLASHTHGMSDTSSESGEHSHKVTGDYDARWESNQVYSVRGAGYNASGFDIATSSTGGHNHKISGTSSSYGSGSAQNLQPYQTCYVWRRIG